MSWCRGLTNSTLNGSHNDSVIIAIIFWWLPVRRSSSMTFTFVWGKECVSQVASCSHMTWRGQLLPPITRMEHGLLTWGQTPVLKVSSDDGGWWGHWHPNLKSVLRLEFLPAEGHMGLDHLLNSSYISSLKFKMEKRIWLSWGLNGII